MHVGIKTHVGNVRANNEDASLIRLPLLAVADGMGGHDAGEVASAVALKALAESDLSEATAQGPAARIEAAVGRAHRRIVDAVAANPALRNMGTTLTALWLENERAHVAHVGDSRAYLWRDGDLRVLTTDHTIVAELVQAGQIDNEDASTHPQRNVLTRALSAAAPPKVDILTIDKRAEDVFLLCTDGLTVHVTEEEIAAVLAERLDVQRTADVLVQRALDGGGTDNVTVVVACSQRCEVIR